MKKILAISLAVVMALCLSVSVFAEERVVFDNPEGEAFSDLVNPWGLLRSRRILGSCCC